MQHDKPKDDEARARRAASKSYSLDGNTAEFDAGANQIHEFSPEQRRKMSETKLPPLDPKLLEDTFPPNLNVQPPPPPTATHPGARATAATANAARGPTRAHLTPLGQNTARSSEMKRRPIVFGLMIAAAFILFGVAVGFANRARQGSVVKDPVLTTGTSTRKLTEIQRASSPANEPERVPGRPETHGSASPSVAAPAPDLQAVAAQRERKTSPSVRARAIARGIAPAPRPVGSSLEPPLLPNFELAPAPEAKSPEPAATKEASSTPRADPSSVPTPAPSSKRSTPLYLQPQ